MGEQKVTKSFEELSENVSVIAKPLATEKLVKKLAKLLAAASGRRTCTRRGVKEVVKAVRKGSKGICVIAGDVSPIDIICHLPVLCEDREIPYIYMPSKEQLGASLGSLRPTSSVLILREPKKPLDEKEEKVKKFEQLFDEVSERVKAVSAIESF